MGAEVSGLWLEVKWLHANSLNEKIVFVYIANQPIELNIQNAILITQNIRSIQFTHADVNHCRVHKTSKFESDIEI